MATVSSTGTTYHHADHLSVRLSTDTNGNKIGEQGHYPYGEPWYQANTTTKFFFTSYERDNESGLDYAMARYYISRFGRYCSMDPVGGSPLDPQSWNRYAYVRNNPINGTDPSGTFWHWLFNAFLTFITSGMHGIGSSLPGGVPMPTPSSPEIWSEQLPISTSSGGIPPGGIIDESGGFGNGFVDNRPWFDRFPCDRRDPTNAKIIDFIKAHKADADTIGKKLGIQGNYVLGVSGEETGFGTRGIVVSKDPAGNKTNNYFGLHVDGPEDSSHYTGQTGVYKTTGKPSVYVAEFADSTGFLDSGNAFADTEDQWIHGTKQATTLARTLHQHGYGTTNKNYERELLTAIDRISARENCQ